MNFRKYRVHFNNSSDCSDDTETDDSDDTDSDTSCSGISSAPSAFCCAVKPSRSRSTSKNKSDCRCFAKPTKSDVSRNVCPKCRTDGSKSSLRCSSKPILKEKKSERCCSSERMNKPSTVKFDLDPPDIDFCAENNPPRAPRKRKKSKERCFVANSCVPMGRMRRREERRVDDDCYDDCDWVDINRPAPEDCPRWSPPRKRWSSEDIFALCKLLTQEGDDCYLSSKMRDLLKYRGHSDGRICNDRICNDRERDRIYNDRMYNDRMYNDRICSDRIYNLNDPNRQQSAASRIRSSVGDLPLRDTSAKEKLLLRSNCIPPRNMSLSSMSRYGARERRGLAGDKIFIPYAIPRDKSLLRDCPENMCQPGFQIVPSSSCDPKPLKSKCSKKFRFRFPLKSHCKGKKPKKKFKYAPDCEDDWVERSEEEDPNVLPPTSIRHDRIRGAFRNADKLRGGSNCEDDASLASFAPTSPTCPPICAPQDGGQPPPPPPPPPAPAQRTCSPNSSQYRDCSPQSQNTGCSLNTQPQRGCSPPSQSVRRCSPPPQQMRRCPSQNSRRCSPPPQPARRCSPPPQPPRKCSPVQVYRACSPSLQCQSNSSSFNYGNNCPSRTRLQVTCQPQPADCDSFEITPAKNFSVQCNPIKNPFPSRFKAEIMQCHSNPQCPPASVGSTGCCSICGPMKIVQTDAKKNCSFVEFFTPNERCEECNKGCTILSALLHSFIILMLAGTTVLVFVWAFLFRKAVGFSATDAQANINYHPVMMICGFITLSGFSLLVYRIGQCCRHGYMQCLHLALHGLAIPCIALGASAAFNYHKLSKPREPHLVTLHSWMGLVTLTVFTVQFSLGFLSFILSNCCSGWTQRVKEAFIPFHATLGLTTLSMAIATCLTGLTQRILYVSARDPKATAGIKYSGIQAYFEARIGEYGEALVVNLLGAFLIILAFLMPLSLRRPCPKPMTSCGC